MNPPHTTPPSTRDTRRARVRPVRRWSWRGRDDGVATVGLLLSVVAVIVAGGFVWDVAHAVRGWNTAHDQAAQAARAGAQRIDLNLYRRIGTIQLDPAAATQAAQAFLTMVGGTGTATATLTTVTVTVTRTTTNDFLGLVGIGTFTEHATVTATPLHGVAGPAP
jgi:Flp pilus assembly protein TadG